MEFVNNMQATEQAAFSESFRITKTYKRNIDWMRKDPSAHFLQIYTKGLEFALVSDKNEQVHQFVLCKDFLHDVIFSCLHNICFDIYKFVYDPDTMPSVCLRKMKLLVTNSSDKKFRNKIKNALEFLNKFEDLLRMPRSTVRECKNPPSEYERCGVYLFEGNRRWLQAPPMVSLYTLLLRIGFSHVSGYSFWQTVDGLKNKSIKPYQRKDAKWIRVVEPALNKIVRLGDKNIFYKNIRLNYPRNMHMETIHNHLGILNFAHDMACHESSITMRYWHRLK